MVRVKPLRNGYMVTSETTEKWLHGTSETTEKWLHGTSETTEKWLHGTRIAESELESEYIFFEP